MYSLISVDKYTHIFTYLLNQGIEHFVHPQNVPIYPFQVNSLHARDNYYCDFYHYRFVLLVLELYINGVI